jgi:hypothetical protein
MREVIEHVETTEMQALGVAQPDVMEDISPPDPSPIPQMVKPFDPALHPRLRKAYRDYRKRRFEKLLRRVPSRAFPTFRLPAMRSDLKDAMTDRWLPRPYPMSTRPLYLTSPPPEGVEEPIGVEVQPKKRKRGEVEEEVMFEMPVSLEMLDERVEAGAKKAVNRRVGKLRLDKGSRRSSGASEGDGGLAGLSKKHGKRYIPGAICEGCAGVGLKVWRRGPGGKGTCESSQIFPSPGIS